MKITEEFGTFCAQGERAIVYLDQVILPGLENDNELVLDFEGVKNMNSSFANAMFANLVRIKGESVLQKISFKNVRSNVQSAIKMGLYLGLTANSPNDEPLDKAL